MMLEQLDLDDNSTVNKIFRICELLDEELQQYPTINKKIIATMYYLASLRIKHVFGFKIDKFQPGHKELYALSGFKKPLNQLIKDYDNASDLSQANKIRLELIRLSNFFDDRFGEITKRPLVQTEYLNSRSQILLDNASLNTNHLHDFY